MANVLPGNKRRHFLLLSVTLWAAAVAACATNPATGRRQISLMSEDRELQLGQEQDVLIRREMGVYDDPALQQYVSDIGLRLAQASERPNLPWHFTVVDAPAVNAFALPGGYIYITRGILAFLGDEAELACVLGHEIGHVTARHAAGQYSKATGASLGVLLGSIFVPEARPFGELAQTGVGALLLKYGRDDELQADQLGVRYASRAGWNPEGMPRMLATLGRIEEASDRTGVPNWLSTHPAAENRVARVQAAVREAEAGAAPSADHHDEYLRRVDGIVYGDNPDQGVVRGSAFLHPALRFAIEFPEGWQVTNGETEVVAKQQGADAVMVLQPVKRPPGRSIEQIALQSMQSAGLRHVEGRQTSINGLTAFVGTYQGVLRDLGRVGVRGAHIVHERDVFLVAGIAPVGSYDRVESAFTRALESFRPMTRGEAETIRPNRVSLYTARTGDTWVSIAERDSQGLVKGTTLAIMNGRAPDDQPRAGARLKIVVSK